MQHIGNDIELLIVGARERDDGLQLLDGLLAQSVVAKLLVHVVESNLVELVDGHGDVHNLVGLANHLGNAGEDLTVIDLDLHTDA